MENRTTNAYQPLNEDMETDGVKQGPTNFKKRILLAVFALFGITAAGPAIWLLILVMIGWIHGEPLRVFHNHLIWEDEFVAKAPIAVVISVIPAFQVAWEMLTEKKSPKCAGDTRHRSTMKQ
jgi:hypothetical protein